MTKNKQTFFLISLFVLLIIGHIQLIGQTQNGVTSIDFPGGGAYSSTSVQTGAIKIKLPYSNEYSTLKMRVEVYNFLDNTSFSMWISGFIYSDSWSRISAQILASNSGKNYKVSYGAENGKGVVWIGNHTDTWTSVKVELAEVQVSHIRYTLGDWDDGWEITLDNQDFSSLVSKTISSTLPKSPIQGTIRNSQSDMSRILYPGGGEYNGSNTETGAIKIKLPYDNEYTTLRLRLEVYNFLDNTSFSMWVSGFIYSNSWSRISAQILASNSGKNYKVSYGSEGGKGVIWIGNHTETWTSVKVQIAEVMVSHVQYAMGNWDDGWEVSLENQDFSSQVDKTIGSTLPLAAIHKTVKNSESNMSRILYPGGGEYNGSGDETGAIKIKLPYSNEYTTMRIRLEVYNFLDNTSFSMWISGFTYADTWSRISAQLLASHSGQNHKVRYGSENGTGVIWIGEQTSNWKDLKVEMAEVLISHVQYAMGNWDDGWEITLDNQDFSANVSKTISNTLPLASAQTVWSYTNDDIFFSSGNVAIGTSNPDTFKLAVDGAIKAKEIRVNTTNWPDYVFESDYQLMPLKEVGQFIEEHGHLPNIPKKKEAEKEGVQVGALQKQLLQKIEELTLYLLEFEEKFKQMEMENKTLKLKIKALENQNKEK